MQSYMKDGVGLPFSTPTTLVNGGSCHEQAYYIS